MNTTCTCGHAREQHANDSDACKYLGCECRTYEGVMMHPNGSLVQKAVTLAEPYLDAGYWAKYDVEHQSVIVRLGKLSVGGMIKEAPSRVIFVKPDQVFEGNVADGTYRG